ncbi:MAG: hypothetical protein V8R17_10215 [Blautia obeum]
MQKKWQNEKKDRMMSDKKAVFFDADGTICDIEKGVPDSAIESIKETDRKWTSGMAVYGQKPCICAMVS